MEQVLSKVYAPREVSQQYNRDVLIENPRDNGFEQLPTAEKLSCSRNGNLNRKPRISGVAHLEFPNQRAANAGDTGNVKSVSQPGISYWVGEQAKLLSRRSPPAECL